ncbi:MAG4530 family protein [Mycoplasma sp. 5370]
MKLNSNIALKINYFKLTSFWSLFWDIVFVINFIICFVGSFYLINTNYDWYTYLFFWIVFFIWTYLSIIVIFHILFIVYYQKNKFVTARKILSIIMFLKFNFKLFSEFKMDKETKNIFKVAKEISKNNQNALFLGSFASYLTFEFNRKINDLDFCSQSSKVLNLSSLNLNNNENLVNTKLVAKGKYKNIKIDSLLFRFIPEEYLVKKYNFTIPNKEFQFASKLIQLYKQLNLENKDETKIGNLLLDLKHLSLENWEFSFNSFKEVYKDVILHSSQFSLISNFNQMLKYNIDLKIGKISALKEEKIFFEINFKKISLYSLLENLETNFEVKTLRKSFDNEYDYIMKNYVIHNTTFSFENPIFFFKNEKEKEEFLEENQINKNFVLLKNFSFKNPKNSMDRRELYMRLIAKKYEKILGEKNE